MSRDLFTVVDAAQLSPERDVFLGLPVESGGRASGPGGGGAGNRPGFHRVPIRSARTESDQGDRRVRVQFVPGSANVVQSCQGLQRLLIRFPNAFVPGIRVFEGTAEGERTNLSMGFALYDHRVGPTPEEERVLENIDALALFLRSNIVRCDRIRRTLKLGPDGMNAQQQQVAVEMMDLHVARPAAASPRGAADETGQHASSGVPPRYCYVKLVPPDPTINEKYHTYFWTVDGKRIPFETVVAYRNFHVIPLIEPEDIFVSKAVRSVQLKLRECIVVPPPERMLQRVSVLFPDRVCCLERDEAPDHVLGAAAAASPPDATTTVPVSGDDASSSKRERDDGGDGDDEDTQPEAKRPAVDDAADDDAEGPE